MNNYKLSYTENANVLKIEAYGGKLFIEYGHTEGRFYVNGTRDGNGTEHRSPMGVKLTEVKDAGFINEAKSILSTLFIQTTAMAVEDLLGMAKNKERYEGIPVPDEIREDNTHVMTEYLDHVMYHI